MRMMVFAKRNTKEIVRDPLTLFFGAVFPVILLLLLWLIGRNIPAGAGPDTFVIEKLAPGIALFGLTFITLFSALLVSKDRGDSLMLRLMTSPMTGTQEKSPIHAPRPFIKRCARSRSSGFVCRYFSIHSIFPIRPIE